MPDLWEVFLSPHTDDESIAMAGAITRARLAGLKTCVVLVTDNKPSARQRREFAMHEDLGGVRRAEFMNAVNTLCVDDVQMWEVEEALMKVQPMGALHMIHDRLIDLHVTRDIVHVHTVCGLDDVHVDAGFGSFAHGLCSQVATQFAADHPGIQVSLHGVYVYSKHADHRQACGALCLRKELLSPVEQDMKRLALRCYYPSETCVGYGHKSVPELLDNAVFDPHEYVIEITHNVPVSV